MNLFAKIAAMKPTGIISEPIDEMISLCIPCFMSSVDNDPLIGETPMLHSSRNTSSILKFLFV